MDLYQYSNPESGMLGFDKSYFDHLRLAKKGFSGNELSQLASFLNGYLQKKESHHILDIGSGDGEWLVKIKSCMESLGYEDIHFTALEPIENNFLKEKCSKDKFKKFCTYVENINSLNDKFDVILSTHCAYYFFNQGWAHINLGHLLNPDGVLIVTLISRQCVLNKITRFLLYPYAQRALTAESYCSLMSEIGFFRLEAIKSTVGKFDVDYYINNSDALFSLSVILSRHKLPIDKIEERQPLLRKFIIEECRGKNRINHTMAFRLSELFPYPYDQSIYKDFENISKTNIKDHKTPGQTNANTFKVKSITSLDDKGIVTHLVSEIQQYNFSSLEKALRYYQVSLADINALNSALEKDGLLTFKDSNVLGTNTLSWIGRMIGKTISGEWQVDSNAATELLKSIINKYTGI